MVAVPDKNDHVTHINSNPTKMIAKSQSATIGNDTGDGVDREEMISVAAYYRAEHRGFAGDDSLSDWLGAEAEIDSMLRNLKDTKAHLRGR